MSGHTPGPWHADKPDDFGDFNILHNGNALAIGAVVSNMRPKSEVLSNARLVAAAPDLLDVIRLIQGMNWRLDDEDFGKEIRRRALAAVQKAMHPYSEPTPSPVTGSVDGAEWLPMLSAPRTGLTFEAKTDKGEIVQGVWFDGQDFVVSPRYSASGSLVSWRMPHEKSL